MWISKKAYRKIIQASYDEGLKNGYRLGCTNKPLVWGKPPESDVIKQAEEVLRNIH